ncbi:hypothetical protein F3Y22_tig00110783pilonHSYRG00115 [Hibiscus syriacus]|uniref:Uncharacterized protein n=1 Tax=Hibiscus syriacus TaxID=106335 RepID=A0A6A2ZR72_HIBSY|nr:hypothetical protein F3Y22_tig00110783pilonHSYRG00115 [Hibiscus syriacus]
MPLSRKFMSPNVRRAIDISGEDISKLKRSLIEGGQGAISVSLELGNGVSHLRPGKGETIIDSPKLDFKDGGIANELVKTDNEITYDYGRPQQKIPYKAIRQSYARASEAIRPRPFERAMRRHPMAAERAIRGQPSELCEGIRGQPSEGRSPGVHGDLQGRPEGMTTYVLGRACAMQHVHSLCLSKGRSFGVHGDLQGRPEGMATYDQYCGFHSI